MKFNFNVFAPYKNKYGERAGTRECGVIVESYNQEGALPFAFMGVITRDGKAIGISRHARFGSAEERDAGVRKFITAQRRLASKKYFKIGVTA